MNTQNSKHCTAYGICRVSFPKWMNARRESVTVDVTVDVTCDTWLAE